MSMRFQPWQLLSVILAGILNERQQRSIEYLREENRVLRQQLGKKRIRLTDDQRRRLAAKGKALGRKLVLPKYSIMQLIGGRIAAGRQGDRSDELGPLGAALGQQGP